MNSISEPPMNTAITEAAKILEKELQKTAADQSAAEQSELDAESEAHVLAWVSKFMGTILSLLRKAKILPVSTDVLWKKIENYLLGMKRLPNEITQITTEIESQEASNNTSKKKMAKKFIQLASWAMKDPNEIKIRNHLLRPWLLAHKDKFLSLLGEPSAANFPDYTAFQPVNEHENSMIYRILRLIDEEDRIPPPFLSDCLRETESLLQKIEEAKPPALQELQSQMARHLQQLTESQEFANLTKAREQWTKNNRATLIRAQNKLIPASFPNGKKILQRTKFCLNLPGKPDDPREFLDKSTSPTPPSSKDFSSVTVPCVSTALKTVAEVASNGLIPALSSLQNILSCSLATPGYILANSMAKEPESKIISQLAIVATSAGTTALFSNPIAIGAGSLIAPVAVYLNNKRLEADPVGRFPWLRGDTVDSFGTIIPGKVLGAPQTFKNIIFGRKV